MNQDQIKLIHAAYHRGLNDGISYMDQHGHEFWGSPEQEAELEQGWTRYLDEIQFPREGGGMLYFDLSGESPPIGHIIPIEEALQRWPNQIYSTDWVTERVVTDQFGVWVPIYDDYQICTGYTLTGPAGPQTQE